MKQIIVIMENNKRVIFSSLDLQLEKFSSFLANFTKKIDDFVRDSSNQLATAQQHFEMHYPSQNTSSSNNPNLQFFRDPSHLSIDHEIEHLRIHQKKTEMQESVYLQIKKNFRNFGFQ